MGDVEGLRPRRNWCCGVVAVAAQMAAVGAGGLKPRQNIKPCFCCSRRMSGRAGTPAGCIHGGSAPRQMQRRVLRAARLRGGRVGWEGCCMGVASLRCGLALSASQRSTLPSRRCVCFARLRRRCRCSLHAQAHCFRRNDQVKPHCKCMQSLIKKTMVLAHQFQNLDQWQNIERAVLTNYFDSALCALCKTNERVC